MVTATSHIAAPPRQRLIALRIVAVLWVLVTALASFGLPSLLTGWSTSGDELPLRTMYVVWGILAGIVLPGVGLALLAHPRIGVCRALVALVVASAAALVVGFNPLHLAYFGYVVGPMVLLIALHPDVRSILEPASVDRVSMAIAAAISVPALAWGTKLARESRIEAWLETPSGDFSLHGQYSQAATLAFAIALLALVGALRQPGRWIIVALASVSTALWGIAGIAFPEDATSPGTTWGIVAMVAAAVYVAATAVSERR